MALRRARRAAAVVGMLAGVVSAGVAEFPTLNDSVVWLRTERLRGTLFHDPAVQPMPRRFLERPGTAPGDVAPPLEVVGETYVVLLPDDGVVRATVEAVRGAEAFPGSLYALFDAAGAELQSGTVAPGGAAEVAVAGQSGPCTLLVNSGPGLRSVARIRLGTRFWAIDARPHAVYNHTPLHYHFLRELRLGGFNLALVDFEYLPDAFDTEEGLASWTAKVRAWGSSLW